MLVIVSGLSATGKTTFGRAVARRLGFDFYSKDGFKERLFAEHRRNKLLWWRWYDTRAKELLFEQIARSVGADESVVVESNFEPGDRRRFAALGLLSSSNGAEEAQGPKGAKASKGVTNAKSSANFKGSNDFKNSNDFKGSNDAIVELYFHARPSIALKRYVRRLRTGEKHRGHYDWLWTPVFVFDAFTGWRFRPTGIAQKVVRVDTTDFGAVSVEDIVQRLQ